MCGVLLCYDQPVSPECWFHFGLGPLVLLLSLISHAEMKRIGQRVGPRSIQKNLGLPGPPGSVCVWTSEGGVWCECREAEVSCRQFRVAQLVF